MSGSLHVVQTPPLEQAAQTCPLLDDQASREAWVACCTKRFLGLARRVAGGDALAEEVLQESWIRVLTHACEYRGSSPACSWVGTIVANCAKDYRDREDRERHPRPAFKEGPDPTRDPRVQAQERELLGLVHAIVAELPGKSREVYSMRYLEGLSTAETAESLGISKSAVASRLDRAVGMIKKRLVLRMRNAGKHKRPGT